MAIHNNILGKSEMEHPLKASGKLNLEIDKVMFWIAALHDGSRELSALKDEDKIAEIFLLLVMGVFGIGSGYLVFADQKTRSEPIKSKGLEEKDVLKLHRNLPQLMEKYPPYSSQSGLSSEMDAWIVPKEDDDGYSLFPSATEVVIQWSLDRSVSGFLGLGKKILEEQYSKLDLAFLVSFTRDFMIHIANTRSAYTITKMQKHILEKDRLLQKTSELADRNRRKLSKHYFHLKVLYDMAHEVMGLKDPGKIMETFLLGIMGAFSMGEGFLLLINREKKEARMTCRAPGIGKAIRLSDEDIAWLTHRLFRIADKNGLSTTDVRVITDRTLLESAAIPFNTRYCLLFMVDRETAGLVGLRKMGVREDPLGEELEFLQLVVNNFTAFYKNARSLEKIQQLNEDLKKKNLELTKAVDKLSASSLKIEVLEKTRKGIKAAIQKEMRRARRISAMDFMLILAVAVTLGLLYNYTNPAGINIIPVSWVRPSPPSIETSWAKIKYDVGKSLFVDARPPEMYQKKHIQGAVNLPVTVFDFVYMMKFGTLDPRRELIVYGRNISRLYDEEVAMKLISRGHGNVKILAGGLSAWENRGYPLEQ